MKEEERFFSSSSSSSILETSYLFFFFLLLLSPAANERSCQKQTVTKLHRSGKISSSLMLEEAQEKE